MSDFVLKEIEAIKGGKYILLPICQTTRSRF